MDLNVQRVKHFSFTIYIMQLPKVIIVVHIYVQLMQHLRIFKQININYK